MLPLRSKNNVRAFITNKMITLVHHSKFIETKTYPSNGDYQYLFNHNNYVCQRDVRKITRAYNRKLRAILGTLCSELYMRLGYSYKHTHSHEHLHYPIKIGKLHPCDQIVFFLKNFIYCIPLSEHTNFFLFINQQPSMYHIYFYEYICSTF